ncbi:hypothetical protein J7T55_006395 [Diaporthe amygdali]|uniref:uncharacterized protein n=1 Tax=Phomopsis amygdali TaxID=1214568 RepID=UPI0022FDB9F8|nr:uncharacterized protein J7T55_006395 [Diaporthe amygdali]KAJ0125051.1 hypothetical protein J7T55_006395 [Diaporthe amygdali]
MVLYTSLLLVCLLGHAAAGLAGTSDTRLVSRNPQVSKDGTLTCGTFGSASKQTVPNLLNDLLPGGKIADKVWTIGPNSCHRVHCYDTSGIYVCNDNSKEMRVAGHMVAKGVKCITDNCCTVSTVNNNFSKGQSGQKFYRGAGASFNIVVAYGNCGHDANVRPADELGWGVNGVCDGGVLSPEYDGCDVL